MKIFNLITFLILSLWCNAQNTKYIWMGKIKSEDKKTVEFANIQVIAKGKYYLFMSDNNGNVEVTYPEYHTSDSVIISRIGYKTKKISCSELKHKEVLIIETETYKIDEVIVKPAKHKIKKLGNKNWFTINSYSIGFKSQAGLYIPNRGIEGKITTVRVYMSNFSDKNWRYRPFRLRLFEGGYPFNKEITKAPIIASLKRKRGHWAEIDISNFNFDFPKNGVLVVIEVLPYQYYKQNGYINSIFVTDKSFRDLKKRPLRLLNSLTIGFTSGTKTKDKLVCYKRHNTIKDWTPIKNHYFLIQIKVKHQN